MGRAGASPKPPTLLHVLFTILLWRVTLALHRLEMFALYSAAICRVHDTTSGPTSFSADPHAARLVWEALGGCSECSARPFLLRPLGGCGHAGWHSPLMGTESVPFSLGVTKSLPSRLFCPLSVSPCSFHLSPGVFQSKLDQRMRLFH